MKKYVTLFETKDNELRDRIKQLKSTEYDNRKNTRSTQLVKCRRERKTLNLINELLNLLPEDTKLSEDAQNHIVNITTLVSERASTIRFECKKGDKIVDLLQKYNTMTNLVKKMNDYCEENGLVVNFAKGTIDAVQPTKSKGTIDAVQPTK